MRSPFFVSTGSGNAIVAATGVLVLMRQQCKLDALKCIKLGQLADASASLGSRNSFIAHKRC